MDDFIADDRVRRGGAGDDRPTVDRPAGDDDRPVAPAAAPAEEPSVDGAGESGPDDPSGRGPGATGSGSAEHWWEAPGLPWRHKPNRAEITCFLLYAAIGVYSLILLPLKPLLLAADPIWLALANGSRVALVAIGGMVGSGEYPAWPLALVLATLSIVKFDPIYWWAGRLWGDGILDAAGVGTSERSLARRERAKSLTRRYLPLAVAVTHLPIPFPDLVVGVAAGASGVSLRKYLLLDVLFALPVRAAYLYLGFVFHEQAMAVVTVVERYSLYLSLGILAVMLVVIFTRRRRAANGAARA